MKITGQLIIGRFLVLAIVVLAWEIAAMLSQHIEFAIARPTTIWTELLDLLRDGKVFPHIEATGGAAILGLMLGTLLGTLLGLLTWFSRSTTTLLKPFVLAIGAMPILAVAPLMIIWFGIGFQMKVALACLSTIFVAFSQSAKGAEKVSDDYLQVLRGMNATRKQVFVMAVVPGSMDWVFSGMKLNAGLALLGAFIGEFIASNIGLGYLVLKASSLYNVPRAIAASLFIVALALLFDWLASLVEEHRNRIIKLICIPTSAWRTHE
jgi:NitT/TauT family transport system permease protein